MASYIANKSLIETSVRDQLRLAAEQKIKLESAPFAEVAALEANFLKEFAALYADQAERLRLAGDFDKLFVRRADGSYRQGDGIFEGQTVVEGQTFRKMSATYAPDVEPNEDVKARFSLSFFLSHKYGSVADGRLFNFYGVVPEKGFPIYQAEDVGKAFVYEGPDALKLETYEFYKKGFAATTSKPIFTHMYFDSSNKTWMSTIITPDMKDDSGFHKIAAAVDIPLNDFMRRANDVALEGAYGTVFEVEEGTLFYDPKWQDQIEKSGGTATIASLGLSALQPVLAAARKIRSGETEIVSTPTELVAVGRLTGTPWAFAVRYPKALMWPLLSQNLGLVVLLCVVSLVGELVMLRSILRQSIERPLLHFVRAMRQLGEGRVTRCKTMVSPDASSEIDALADEFDKMAQKVEEGRIRLEQAVRDRTVELERLNTRLSVLSFTDPLTGLSNRRRFDEALRRWWLRATLKGDALSLVIIDVDWFKSFNDTYGHGKGDECLKLIGEMLLEIFDNPSQVVARYGGEEFAVILPATHLDDAVVLAAEFGRRVTAQAIPHARSPFQHVTVSLGVAARTPSPETMIGDLFRGADSALYRAKAGGRNQLVVEASNLETATAGEVEWPVI